MNQNKINTLLKRVIGSLKRAKFSNGILDIDDILKEINYIEKQVLTDKKTWLDDLDVLSEYTSRIYDALNEKTTTNEDKSVFTGNLIDFLNDDEIEEISNDLISFFISIPRNYEVKIPLPSIPYKSQRPINIANNISIENLPYSPETIFEYFTADRTDEKPHLRIIYQGYLSKRENSKGFQNLQLILKIVMHYFISIKFASVIQKTSNKAQNIFLSPDEDSLFFHINDIEIEKSFTIKTLGGLASSLARLSFDERYNSISSHDEESIQQIYDLSLSVLLSKLDALLDDNSPEANKIKLAIRWHFDSLFANDEILSLIQLSIGFEALLGNEDEASGLTDRLSDRLGYVVARNVKSRKFITRQFREFYSLRSKVVHGSTIDLSANDSFLIDWAKKILFAAIYKEVDLLK